jgi:hypothetical protein
MGGVTNNVWLRDTPARMSRNHTLFDTPSIRFILQVTQKYLRRSLMMAGSCRNMWEPIRRLKERYKSVRSVGFSNISSGLCCWADSILLSWASPGPPDRLTLQYQTTCSQDYVKSKVYETRPANADIAAFKGSPRKCYKILWQPSFATAGVYWATGWSRTEWHIETIITEMNSHRHGVHPKMLKKENFPVQ